MKTTQSIIATVAIAAAMYLNVGCVTTTEVVKNADGTSTTNIVKHADPVRVQKVSEIVSRMGGTIAITASKRPELKNDFALAANGIDVMLLDGNYDPVALRATLSKVNVSTDDEIWLIGSTLLDAYDLLVSDVVSQQLDKSEWLKPVLIGVRNGLLAASGVPKASLPTK